jgi:hypothetical protein
MGKQENRQTNQFPGKGKAEGENLMKNEKNYFEFFLNFYLTFIGITLWLKLIAAAAIGA